MCLLKIYKSSPSNMIDFHLLPAENVDEIFYKRRQTVVEH